MDYSTLTVYSKRILKIHTTLAKLETEKIDSNVTSGSNKFGIQIGLVYKYFVSVLFNLVEMSGAGV